eukprot:TRINITY_DN25433_c0_g1_i1.p2 TRINITY_DN25433_c0_g1~~TRINITY_DN25433_c0_g1_i1.p2  ORF type:complete len:193 (+),score=73.10 TRINITY_DN25433_c0_g1_i1:65-643(+)
MLRAAVSAMLVTACAAEYINPRPSWMRKADFARWLVHESNWTIVAAPTKLYNGTAFPNMMATSDSESRDSCTGVPYLYFAAASTMWQDINENPRVTLGFFETGLGDQYCVPSAVHDPEDPQCAKVHIVGDLKVIDASEGPAKLFWRHPAMKMWPKDHGWMVAQLDIVSVDILNFYGGLGHVPVADYLAAKCK